MDFGVCDLGFQITGSWGLRVGPQGLGLEPGLGFRQVFEEGDVLREVCGNYMSLTGEDRTVMALYVHL